MARLNSNEIFNKIESRETQLRNMKDEEENRRVRYAHKNFEENTIELTDVKRHEDKPGDKLEFKTASKNIVEDFNHQEQELWQSGEEAPVMHDYTITFNDKL